MTQITKRRTKKDVASFVKKLVDEKYQDVESHPTCLDNLYHNKKSFYETFSKDEAERILSKIKFHYTPMHVSWLAVEIEINVIDIECIGK